MPPFDAGRRHRGVASGRPRAARDGLRRAGAALSSSSASSATAGERGGPALRDVGRGRLRRGRCAPWAVADRLGDQRGAPCARGGRPVARTRGCCVTSIRACSRCAQPRPGGTLADVKGLDSHSCSLRAPASTNWRSVGRFSTGARPPSEARARLPGDELLEDADGVSTRAITIDAPASAGWPWLAQMGPAPRGGAYTYDWIENLLGLDMHSADRVLPEFQHPQLGDRSASARTDAARARSSPDACSPGGPRTATGSGVRPRRTRRPRRGWSAATASGYPRLAARIAMLPMEPGSLVMEHKMLRGIKQRAERKEDGITGANDLHDC